MKTEPTEALKIIDFWGFYHSVDEEEYIDIDNSTKAVNLAFKEGQSNPKIKQLEWEDNKNCLTKGITARTSFCTYQTMELSNGNSSLFTDNRIICQDFPIDYIKQYAQEDFETRVKKCLIIE